MNLEQLRTLLFQDPKRVFVGSDDDYRDEFGHKRLPLDFRELEFRSYEWRRYWKLYPEKQEEMLEWKRKLPKTQRVSLGGGLTLPPPYPIA